MKKIFFSMALLGVCSVALAQSDPTPSISSDSIETSPRSSGGFFLEPFLTYEQNDTSIKTSSLPLVSNDTSGDNRGFGIGTRIGGHLFETLFLAADVRFARQDLKDSFYSDAVSEKYNYGITAGAQTPIAGLRVWGTYLVGGQMDPEAGAYGLDLKFKDLTGYRVGLGLYVKAVSINLEYQDMTYDKTEIQSWGSIPVQSSTNMDTKESGYTLGIGFPLEL